MLKNSRALRIEWSDCDPAGIVFYPRYFAMFDHSTTMLISAASGLTKSVLLRKYDAAGYPMVDTRAKFILPTRFGDDVVIESSFSKVGRSSFEICHRLLKDGQLAVEGFETRVWVARDPADASRFKAESIPSDLAARFMTA
jgi:4-hydroxybenzoyl-CoA thioesterase